MYRVMILRSGVLLREKFRTYLEAYKAGEALGGFEFAVIQ